MPKKAKVKLSIETQLTAYEVGAKVYDQIISIQTHLATVANLFLLITGVLWATTTTNQLGLPSYVSSGMLAFHLIGSVATLQIIASCLNAINLRYFFLLDFGERYYPEIEEIGKKSFMKVYHDTNTFKARFARGGRQPLLWYLIPIAGFLGSLYLFISSIKNLLF